MDLYLIIEAISVLLNLVFLFLLIKRSRMCWPFGVLGSTMGVFLFVAPGAAVKLYSEAILYSYYIWIGIFGWYQWSDKESLATIKTWSTKENVLALLVGFIAFPILGFVMERFFDSNSPYLDALTTTFSFIASYMQAKRVLTSWHFWIVINAISIYLYLSRGLNLYAGLMAVYFVFSIYGLYQWKKTLFKTS